MVARAAIVVGLLTTGALLLPNSLAVALGDDHPALAARIAPHNARLATALAAGIGGDPRQPQIRQLVQTALARDLTDLPGLELRAADLALSNRRDEAQRLFELSDRMSRRSLSTRLWLIQASVYRGDVEGALANYDIALKTSTEAPPILFPVLAKASADPTITVPLARLLDRPSDWRLSYFEWALADDPDLHSLGEVMMAMHDRQLVSENKLDQRLIEQLVTKADFVQALRLKRRFDPRPLPLLADAHFADPEAQFPFGWSLVSDGSIGAERSLSSNGAMLAYRATSPHSGQIAAQLLFLRPGQYGLATRTAAAATGKAPLWSVTCGQADGSRLAELEQPMTLGSQAASAFTVPAGCPAQWLALNIQPDAGSAVQSGAIEWISITPR